MVHSVGYFSLKLRLNLDSDFLMKLHVKFEPLAMTYPSRPPSNNVERSNEGSYDMASINIVLGGEGNKFQHGC